MILFHMLQKFVCTIVFKAGEVLLYSHSTVREIELYRG